MDDRIVFLCTGNICRSPLAEVIATQKFKDLGLRFASAGLSAADGLPASRSSVAYAARYDIALAAHQSQSVSADLLAGTAWIIGMTRSHAAIFGSRYGAVYAGATGLLGAPGVDLSGQTYSPEAEEVDDPYGLSQDTYDGCGDQINRLLDRWAASFAAVAKAAATGKSQET